MRRIFFISLLLQLSILSLNANASGGRRVVVLPKLTVEGKSVGEASLEAQTVKSLTALKVRVVELSAALSAQRVAFSDSVAEGKIPDALSVLNADAMISLQLSCDMSSSSVMGSKIKAYYCVMSSKAVRVANGDVIHTDSKSFVTHGTNALMAVNNTLAKRMPRLIESDAKVWMAALEEGDGTWHADIVVAGLKEQTQATKVQQSLAALEGVDDARKVVFGTGFSKFTVEGKGKDNYQRLAERIETSGTLPLSVVYEAGSVIHTQFDLSKIYSKTAALFVYTGRGRGTSRLGNIGREMSASAMANLAWIRIVDAQDVSDKKLKTAKISKLAAASGAQVGISVEIFEKKEKYFVSIAAVDAATGRKQASATRDGSDLIAVLNGTVDALKGQYEGTLQKQLAADSSGQEQSWGTISDDMAGLVLEQVHVAQLFQTGIAYYRDNAVGRFIVRNTRKQPFTNGVVRFRFSDSIVGELGIGDLKPGESKEIPIKLNTVPENTGDKPMHKQLVIDTRYQCGETFVRTTSHAPIVIHELGVMDWSLAKSVVAFINSRSPQIRDIATRALGDNISESSVSRQIGQAAIVFESVFHAPLKYVKDPPPTGSGTAIDTVQFPLRTLERKAGDCDDFTVLLAALYESVGISTAIIVVENHVLLGVSTGVLVGGDLVFNLPESSFFDVDGALFVPVETTAIGASFANAWKTGMNTIKAAGDNVYAFRTGDAMNQFPPMTSPESNISAELKPLDNAEVVAALKTQMSRESGKASAVAHAVNRLVVVHDDSELGKLSPEDLAQYPLLQPLVAWMKGDLSGARNLALQQCADGAGEACHNLAVMIGYLEPDSSKARQSQRLAYDMAVLPDAVYDMLIQRGEKGLDSDSRTNSVAKNIGNVLSDIRSGKGESASGGFNFSPVAANMGAEERAPAAMQFFWNGLKKE